MNRKAITILILVITIGAAGYVIITNFTVPKVGTGQGDLAPDYTLPMYNGEEGSLSDYEDRVIIMNMWASWCKPCTREIPALMKFHNEYKKEGVSVITVNMNSYERNQEEAEKFVNQYNMTQTPAMIDEEGEVAELYKLQLLPTTYVIDQNRKIVERIIGETTFEQLEEKVQPLLNET